MTFYQETDCNLLGYLLDKVIPTYVINPLHTNLYRESLSLRQTKTNKVDAHTIASMLMSDMNMKSCSKTSYHNEEFKSLIRYRFDRVKDRAQLKQSISCLVCILFPELEKLIPTLHQNSVYKLLYEIKEIENGIKNIMDDINSPILSILRICYRMGAMIIAEIGNFSQFDSPDKILAYACMSPSTYQSGQLNNCHSRMEKRGSSYLRYALYNATKKLIRFIYHLESSSQQYIKAN